MYIFSEDFKTYNNVNQDLENVPRYNTSRIVLQESGRSETETVNERPNVCVCVGYLDYRLFCTPRNRKQNTVIMLDINQWDPFVVN